MGSTRSAPTHYKKDKEYVDQYIHQANKPLNALDYI